MLYFKKTLTYCILFCYMSVFAQNDNELILTEGELMLFKAVNIGNIKKIDSLLSAGTSPNVKFFDQANLLAYATYKGDLNIIKKLIENGAILEPEKTQNSFIKSPVLAIAIKKNKIEILKYFIENGASINLELANPFIPQNQNLQGVNVGKYSMLIEAVINNNLEAAKIILENNTDVNYINLLRTFDRKNALMFAIENGNIDMVKVLLNFGALVNIVPLNSFNQNTFSPLMYAAENGNTQIIKILLGAGANINYEDHFKNTALKIASFNSNKNAFKLIYEIEPTVDLNKLNVLQTSLNHGIIKSMLANQNSVVIGGFFQYKALMRSAKNKWKGLDSLKVLTRTDLDLLEYDFENFFFGFSNIDTSRDSNEIKVSLAYDKIKKKNVEFIEYITKQNIDINARDINGETAIDKALKHNLESVLAILLKAGANPSNISKQKLLELRVVQNDITKFKQLIIANIDAISSKELCSVINLIISKKQNDFLDILIDNNISFNCNDFKGITPFQIATYNNDKNLIIKLLNNGAKKNKGDNNGVLPYHIAKFNNHNEVILLTKPDELNDVKLYDTAKTTAIIEAQLLHFKEPYKSYKLLSPYEVYNAFNIKTFWVNNPLLNFLTTNFDVYKMHKYASALYSSSPLIISNSENSLIDFQKNQNYKSFEQINYNILLKYENNKNTEVTINSQGSFHGKVDEVKESVHDAHTSIGYGIEIREPNWQNTSYSFWSMAGSDIGACGGWDNNCIVSVSGKCFTFEDAIARASSVDLFVKGNQTIPGIKKTDDIYYSSFPLVNIFNEKNTITLSIKQGDIITEIHAGETKNFDRQFGDIVIASNWNDHVKGKGGNCDRNKKLSIYNVNFPSTFDIKNFKIGTSIPERLKAYVDIAANRQWLQKNADELKSWELYGMESLIHLKSELLKEKIKPVVKAELNGIVNFFENINFINLNEGIISLSEIDNIDIPAIETKIDQLISSENTNNELRLKLEILQQQIISLPVADIQIKLKKYKNDYLEVFNKKIILYNLLLLEYSMYISNDELLETLTLDRLPLIDKYLNNFTRQVFKL